MIQRKMSVETAIQVLHSCRSEQEVAQLLEQDGIHGIANVPDRCPASNWIKQQTGVRTSVFYDSVMYPGAVVPNSLTIKKFIASVDANEYPSLATKRSKARIIAGLPLYVAREAGRYLISYLRNRCCRR